MGGLFKAPTPSASSATPTAQVDTAEQEREQRVEALRRQRAGREGTITTSDRGLLSSADWVPQRKSLLGE